jgi:hypothetical protein
MAQENKRFAEGIRAFVRNPATILIKGLLLLAIGFTDLSRDIANDLGQHTFHLGHGLLLIGFFNVLESLPHMLDGLDAATTYAALRDRKKRRDDSSSSAEGELDE